MVEQPGAAEGRWVPLGQPATVGAHVISGGLIYVGRHLPAPAAGVEPALINPDLPATAGAVTGVPAPGPALAYHLLPAAGRGTYLAWLAGGRDSDVPAGLVLLFCFGLERRVLVDGGHEPAVRRELPAIVAEVRRLRARYRAPALRVPLERLHDLLVLLAAPRAGRSVAPAGPGTPGAMAVRVALARYAAAASPVPADWARAWLRHHPSLGRRSVQDRCPDEFDALFAVRYREQRGGGLVPPDDVPGIRLKYQPASPGLTATLVCREDLPDVLAEPRSTRSLGALVDGAAAALDPYRRWLARFPQGRGSLAAAAVLPAELVDPDRGQLGALRVWAEAKLDGKPWAVVDAAEFRAFWSIASPERMARDEAAALMALLALCGFGVEPDVRFGAPALAPGPAVLFRLGPAVADRPGARFPAAAAVARCAAAVASASRPVDPAGPAGAAVLATVRDLAALLRLDPGEDIRLTARLGWSLATGVDVERLGRSTARLDAADREAAGRYLITVAAAADPAAGPATVATLTRVYRILGLEPSLVFPRLHEQSLGGSATTRPVAPPPTAPASAPDPDGPVTVRPADALAHGYALPWAAAAPPLAATPAVNGIPLDRAALHRKLDESAAAATILTGIFDTDPPPDADQPAVAPRPAESVDCIAGLDQPHSQLLRALAARPSWTREEFASLAAAHGVLPDGACDLLNEVAIDTCGAPVVEDDATLAVNDDVLQELLT